MRTRTGASKRAIKRAKATIHSAVMFVGLLFCVLPVSNARETPLPTGVIHYTLKPVAGVNGVDALEVEVRFVGNSQGKSIFKLPSDADGGHERWRYLSRFEGRDVRIVASDQDKRTLLYKPGDTVTVRYRVRAAYVADPTAGDFLAGPAIRPHWLATLGEFIFIVPEDAETTSVTFEWKPGSAHWQALSNLDHQSADEPVTVRHLLGSSIIARPDLKVVERPIFGGILRMAAVGPWSAPIDEYAEVVSKIVSAQRAFWGDMTGALTVTMVALAGSGDGYGGVGRYRGFAHYVSEAATPARQSRTIAHEHIHSWVPGRLGEMPKGNDEAALYWFSEGFTEFYTQRTLLRSGIWSLEDFVDDLNETLAAYTANPNNRQPNDWTSARFWTDHEVQRIPYMRGNLLAYLLDNQLRQASANTIGLDQLIFRMRDRWVSAQSDRRPGVLENLKASYHDLLGSEDQLDAAVESYITKGEIILLPANMFGECATIDSDAPTGQTVHLAPMNGHQRAVCAEGLP